MKPRIRVTLVDRAVYDPCEHTTIVTGRAEYDGIFRYFALGISQGFNLGLLDAPILRKIAYGIERKMKTNPTWGNWEN